MKEVSKWPILVDPSTSNNPIMREAAWEQARNVVNVTLSLTLERGQWPSSNLSVFHKLRIKIFANYRRGWGLYDHTILQIHLFQFRQGGGRVDEIW